MKPKCPFPFDKIVVPRTALLYPAYKNNNKRVVARVRSVQRECTGPLGTWNYQNFKPEFLLNGKRPSFLSSNSFFECKHPIRNKSMVMTEPAVPNCTLPTAAHAQQRSHSIPAEYFSRTPKSSSWQSVLRPTLEMYFNNVSYRVLHGGIISILQRGVKQHHSIVCKRHYTVTKPGNCLTIRV